MTRMHLGFAQQAPPLLWFTMACHCPVPSWGVRLRQFLWPVAAWFLPSHQIVTNISKRVQSTSHPAPLTTCARDTIHNSSCSSSSSSINPQPYQNPWENPRPAPVKTRTPGRGRGFLRVRVWVSEKYPGETPGGPYESSPSYDGKEDSWWWLAFNCL
jgi:hypothetical protein